MNQKCECVHNSVLLPEMAEFYHPKKELPFVTHNAGDCRCTNDLRYYRCDDEKQRWLCSICCTTTDLEIFS